MQRFGEKLRTLRLQHGLSRQKLGEQLGLSESFVKDLEAGRKTPNTRHLLLITGFFSVPTDTLIHDELELGDSCPHCPCRTDT